MGSTKNEEDPHEQKLTKTWRISEKKRKNPTWIVHRTKQTHKKDGTIRMAKEIWRRIQKKGKDTGEYEKMEAGGTSR